MPVLVTAAHQGIARRIATRLLDEGGELRVYTHGDAAALRAAGAFVASGDSDDEGRLEAALADVHTLVHVGGGMLDDRPERMVEDARVALRAAENAEVRRVIALSLPGASRAADDALRRAKGEVEELLVDSPVPSIVIRASLIDTLALRDALVTAGPGPAADQPVAPVAVDDLAELVVAFDRARSSAEHGHLLVAADGPVTLPLGDWTAHLARTVGGRTGRRLPTAVRARALGEALAGPWLNGTGDEAGLDGWSFAGLRPTPPEGLA